MINKDYIAGIFDGEGTIGIHRRAYKDSKRGYLYWPKIRLGMTEDGYPVVRELQKQFNGSTGYRRYKSNNKDLLTWTITSKKDILFFLKSIGKKLVVKKNQADAVIEFFTKGSFSQKEWKSCTMPEEEYARRECLYDKVILLNKKCK